MSYYAHDEKSFQQIKEMLEDLGEFMTQMNSWEHNFIVDLRNRLHKYGREIALSFAQHTKLAEVHQKYCNDGEEKVKDTKDAFDELRDRDKGRRF